jgi:hypothetical protein
MYNFAIVILTKKEYTGGTESESRRIADVVINFTQTDRRKSKFGFRHGIKIY